jgi:hypothetical protein
MGYYTEFKFKAPLNKDYPQILNRLVNDQEGLWKELKGEDKPSMYQVNERPDLPIDHPFGKTVRWPCLFYNSKFDGKTLELDCDINCGYHEIQKFLDWIKPYVRGRKKKIFLGQWRTEDSKEWRNEYKIND